MGGSNCIGKLGASWTEPTRLSMILLRGCLSKRFMMMTMVLQ